MKIENLEKAIEIEEKIRCLKRHVDAIDSFDMPCTANALIVFKNIPKIQFDIARDCAKMNLQNEIEILKSEFESL